MIKIYSHPFCKGCVELKDWLDSRGLEYERGDVNHMHAETGALALPVVVWDEEVIVGYQPKKLQEMYEKTLPNI